mmetsp:Transcript_21536/g.53095  ORF Transcript_21536/g.53095 Transcript_21536/m.53095 type:complete len:84 (-) Transcript_21536:124-375(-)
MGGREEGLGMEGEGWNRGGLRGRDGSPCWVVQVKRTCGVFSSGPCFVGEYFFSGVMGLFEIHFLLFVALFKESAGFFNRRLIG